MKIQRLTLTLKFFLLSILLCIAPRAFAKTLIVSDVDDTIKVGHVLNLTESAKRALDYKTHFFGMPSLFQLIKSESKAQLAYVTNAPAFVMKEVHQKFLTFNRFPLGDYFPRDLRVDKFQHKFNTIVRLVEKVNPSTLILIGDNGELDPEVYLQIRRKFHGEKMRVITYIRTLYSDRGDEKGVEPKVGQLGFVSPFEIALDLEEKKIVSTEAAYAFLETQGLRFLNWHLNPKEIKYVDFQSCAYYRHPLWQYADRFDYVDALSSDILRHCRP